jgi:hypothetical protein
MQINSAQNHHKIIDQFFIFILKLRQMNLLTVSLACELHVFLAQASLFLNEANTFSCAKKNCLLFWLIL